MSIIIYSISIAMQLAGAVLLIIKYFFGTARKQLEEIQKRRTHFEEHTLVIGEDMPTDSEFIEELWLSRIAFVYLAVGYIVGIWGDLQSANKWCVAFIVIVESVFFAFIGKAISHKIGSSFNNGGLT